MNGYTMPEYPAMNVMILKKFTGTRVYGRGERETVSVELSWRWRMMGRRMRTHRK